MKASIKQYAETLLDLTDKKSEQEISAIVKKFAEILKKDGQIKNVKNIIEKFSELYNKKHGIVEATVVTRQDVERQNVDRIEKFIKEKYSAKAVHIRNIVDENIKGGIVIRVGDEILDSSIKSQLNRLKSVLMK